MKYLILFLVSFSAHDLSAITPKQLEDHLLLDKYDDDYTNSFIDLSLTKPDQFSTTLGGEVTAKTKSCTGYQASMSPQHYELFIEESSVNGFSRTFTALNSNTKKEQILYKEKPYDISSKKIWFKSKSSNVLYTKNRNHTDDESKESSFENLHIGPYLFTCTKTPIIAKQTTKVFGLNGEIFTYDSKSKNQADKIIQDQLNSKKNQEVEIYEYDETKQKKHECTFFNKNTKKTENITYAIFQKRVNEIFSDAKHSEVDLSFREKNILLNSIFGDNNYPLIDLDLDIEIKYTDSHKYCDFLKASDTTKATNPNTRRKLGKGDFGSNLNELNSQDHLRVIED